MAFGSVTTALTRARLTGQAVPVSVNGVTMMAYPNGNLGGYGIRSPANALSPQAAQQPTTTLPGPNVPSQAQQSSELGLPLTGTRIQYPLNQANPNTTYVSPNTAQPAAALPVTGQTDTQSGPPISPTYDQPQPATTTLPTVEVQARRYRQHHGLATSDDTDALNAESLAAAQAGRTSFDPTLAAQYGQQPAAGVYGPRTDVVNALTVPTTTTQDAAAQQAQNLLQQGIY